METDYPQCYIYTTVHCNATQRYIQNVAGTRRAYNRFPPPCLPRGPIKPIIIAVSVFALLGGSSTATPLQGFGPPTATLPPVEVLSGWARLGVATSKEEDGNAGGAGEQGGLAGAVGGPLERVG